MDYSTIIPIAVALLAPVGTYVVAARRMSGKIATSDASQLWDESRAIREDYRNRLDSANTRYAKLEERVANLEAKNNELVGENVRLRIRIVELEAQVSTLQKVNEDLQRQLDERA